ncbi:MAG: OmpA family protein [Candidatus Saccharibacteria bacterium]|nr:OmpA family protein [Moraxellaceae bacterium]
MKLNRIALAVLVAAPLSVAVHAETTGLGVTVTPMVGYQGFSGDSRQELGFAPKGDVVGAIALGYELTPSLSVEAQYNDSRNEAGVGAGTADGSARSLEGNFLLNSDIITGDYAGNFKPYVLVGAGQQNLKYGNAKSRDTIVNAGLGAFYRINEALALRVEGRGVQNVDHDLLDWKALTGLQVTLGGHKRPYVAPAPVEVPPAPAPYVAPAPVVVPVPAPVELTEDLKLELRVFFDTNKSEIKKQYQPEIAKVADKLKEFPNATAEIKGYTDSTGPRKLNDRLSQARAEAVKTSLSTDYGIDAGRLTAKGYSWDDPVASNKTVEGRALNRRVVAVILGSRTVTK